MADTIVEDGARSLDQTNRVKSSNTAARAIKEAYIFMGKAYALLRGAARTEQVGMYTAAAAVKDQLAEIEGTDQRKGKIARLQYIQEGIDRFAEQFSRLNKEDLDLQSRGGYAQTEETDGGMTSDPDPGIDPVREWGES